MAGLVVIPPKSLFSPYSLKYLPANCLQKGWELALEGEELDSSDTRPAVTGQMGCCRTCELTGSTRSNRKSAGCVIINKPIKLKTPEWQKRFWNLQSRITKDLSTETA